MHNMKQQFKPDIEQWAGSKLGRSTSRLQIVTQSKLYLSYMHSTSWEMLGWMNPGIRIAGRNIKNLGYADNTTLMTESKEELKSLLMKVEEESEKAGLKCNIQKKIMALGPITSLQIDGETMETVIDFLFLGSKITTDGNCSHEIKRHFILGRKAMTN